jgi:3-isopropylmalate/(R)-2-methylmalate dehydratase small subunit
MGNIMCGKAWTFGPNVNTESIMATGMDFNPELASKTCLAFYDPEFPTGVKHGDIIVADKNFGNSSSRPAGRVLKYLGVSVIICESCARIFFRNTWNIGVPILECPGITKMVEKGDQVEVNLDTGEIKNLTTGAQAQSDKPISVLVDRWKAGGMIEWVKLHRDQYDTLE